MFWCALYVAIAIVVAASAFVTANWIRTEDVVAPDFPGSSALVGALWPIVVLGVTELELTALLAPSRRLAGPVPAKGTADSVSD